MLNDLLKSISTIYVAYGPTDFRKQIPSLCSMVEVNFQMSPYSEAAFIFCNKRRTSIKILCYDKNGFILAQKKLLDKDKMKFQWPRDKGELRNITKEQLNWLLCGLAIYPEKYFKDVDIAKERIAV